MKRVLPRSFNNHERYSFNNNGSDIDTENDQVQNDMSNLINLSLQNELQNTKRSKKEINTQFKFFGDAQDKRLSHINMKLKNHQSQFIKTILSRLFCEDLHNPNKGFILGHEVYLNAYPANHYFLLK